MDIAELVAGGSAGLIAVLSLLQVSKININPWTWLAKTIGRAINGEVLTKLTAVEEQQQKTQLDLEHHVSDGHRTRILAFNNELINQVKHTHEDFVEILAVIDAYELYCRDHPEYPNNRAVHAIANIKRVYDDCLKEHSFLRG